MRSKKIFLIMMTVGLMLLSVTGCKKENAVVENNPNTLTITTSNRNMERLFDAMKREFPDIDFQIEQIYSANQSEYLRQTLITDTTSDIFMSTQKAMQADATEHLLDLSGYDFVSSYDRAILNTYAVDGQIYQLPGPVTARCIAYNKTLFEQNGWNVPQSFAELVELCKRIRRERDDISPIYMSLGGLGYGFTLVTTLSQAGYLATPDGEVWEKEFLAGNASIADGWGEGLTMVAELIDAGAFSDNMQKYVGVWDAQVCGMEFAEGNAAMFFVWGGQEALLTMFENNTAYEYGLFPFYGIEDGQKMVATLPSVIWGLPKRLAEKGNEKKLENALRVLEWFSTTEAQELMKLPITDANGEEISSNAEILTLNESGEEDTTSKYFKEMWELASNGNKMPMIYSGYEYVIINAGQIVQDAILAGSSEGMIEKFVETVDRDYQAYLQEDNDTAFCTVSESFTREETAQLLVNVMNTCGYADFAMLSITGRAAKGVYNKHGSAVRLLAGKIMNDNYNMVLGEDSTKPLQVLTLTGAQVRELLSKGKTQVSIYDTEVSAQYEYYFAGLEVTYDKKGECTSVKCNGAELAEDATYKVLFSYGDYDTDTEANGCPVDREMTFNDMWLQYVKNCSSITKPEVLRK